VPLAGKNTTLLHEIIDLEGPSCEPSLLATKRCAEFFRAMPRELAFGVGAGEILATVQIAMIAGLPYTALRDAVLTHPTLVEGLISLFSSAASVHNVVETRGARISAA
jgi:hypothetical protein